MKKDIKRIFLKISGEALAGKKTDGIDQDYIRVVAKNVISLQKKGYEIALMVGGGNIFRGREHGVGIDRAIGHYSGILAGVINSLVVQNIFYQEGGEVAIFSSIDMPRFVKTFNKISAIKRIERGMIVICAGGAGNPFCSHDLGSVIRALELDCDIVVKCTNVDGIYNSDPRKNPDATRYETLTYQEALSKGLSVMDLAAFGMALENDIPTYVTHIDTLAELDFSPTKGTLVTSS